jgi:hypothetical protein
VEGHLLSDDELARAKLEAMPLNDRIAAVAADVESKRDEYRNMEPEDLVDLLGVAVSEDRFGAYIPDGTWDLTYYVINKTFDDLHDAEITSEDALSLLESEVTSNRFSELKNRFPSSEEDSLSQEDINLLTEPEKATLLRRFTEDYAEQNGHEWVLATYTIDAPNGRKLRFQSIIGDAGNLEELKTPYDERDGAFDDLSDCFITE